MGDAVVGVAAKVAEGPIGIPPCYTICAESSACGVHSTRDSPIRSDTAGRGRTRDRESRRRSARSRGERVADVVRAAAEPLHPSVSFRQPQRGVLLELSLAADQVPVAAAVSRHDQPLVKVERADLDRTESDGK